MLYSMTGFGQACCQGQGWECRAILRSVNSRFLDINFRLPLGATFLEEGLQNIMRTELKRGRVNIEIMLRPQSGEALGLSTTTLNLAKTWIKQMEKALATKIPFGFADLLSLEEKWGSPQLPAKIKPLAEQTLRQASQELLIARSSEGGALAKQLNICLVQMTAGSLKLEELATDAPQHLAKRLRQSLEQSNADEVVSQERLAQEIALLARKVDVSEELERLKHHLKHAYQLLKESPPFCGQKFVFLIQELQRELNTLGSKSEEIVAINCVLELKSQLEKMREQVQNLE